MMPTDPQLLLLLAVAMHGSAPPAPSMPALIHGEYVAAPAPRASPAKHGALTIDAQGIRSASLSCKALSVDGAGRRAHGSFACSPNGAGQGDSRARAFNASIQLRLTPSGGLEVFGLEEDGEAANYVPASAPAR